MGQLLESDSGTTQDCRADQILAKANVGDLISSEFGTYKTVKVRFRPWLSGESPFKISSCPLFVRKLDQTRLVNFCLCSQHLYVWAFCAQLPFSKLVRGGVVMGTSASERFET